LPDRLHQGFGSTALGQVSGGTRLQDPARVHRVFVRGKNQNTRAWLSRENAINRFETANARHGYIHDHDVGLHFGIFAAGIFAAVRFGDDPYVRGTLEEQSKTHSYNRMVVNQHHADVPDRQFTLHRDCSSAWRRPRENQPRNRAV
jgi:hypothetical protein